MKDRTLYICGALAYLVILVSFAYFVVTSSDPDAILIAGSVVSSALMLLTLIFAALVLRKGPSEAYKERYIDHDPEDKDE